LDASARPLRRVPAPFTHRVSGVADKGVLTHLEAPGPPAVPPCPAGRRRVPGPRPGRGAGLRRSSVGFAPGCV